VNKLQHTKRFVVVLDVQNTDVPIPCATKKEWRVMPGKSVTEWQDLLEKDKTDFAINVRTLLKRK
jgi:hypothetical protein